ncbi:MAG: 7-carboxy-7-deazaguanine synthase QueE [Chromatiales bacterium]|jgi:7-carboxy-7-deazaguanine synthase|nr:7-carboxy-7-deazaguanine synthase QueE [Chromatiales bacterium]
MPVSPKSELQPEPRLKITEIFLSIQGEATTSGWPTVFIRLTGCPLRCRYCDTAYAFHGGEWMALEAILERVAASGVRHVCVTGGEPLSQRNCTELMSRLCDTGFEVSIETSGALDVAGIDERVQKVMDLKTPGSGESDRNLMSNLGYLSSRDVLKFVICDRYDYEWARALVRDENLNDVCQIFFSPSWGQVNGADLAEWIMEDKLPVRLQVQLHKVLWGDQPGR